MSYEQKLEGLKASHAVLSGQGEGTVRPLVVDGWQFDTPLDAALHLLWLLQRLSYYEKHREGQPCDGFRFREGIMESRKLLRKLKYKCQELKRPNTDSPANGAK